VPCATHEKAIKIAPFFLFQFWTSKQAFILHYLAFAKIAYFGEKSLLGLLPEQQPSREHGLELDGSSAAFPL